MKAIRVHEFGPPHHLLYEDVPAPQPAADEVVIEVAAAGVNPADWKFRSGMLAAAVRSLPFVPGMDIAGRIVAVGKGVTEWQLGDRVMAMLHLMGNGGYQEQVAVPTAWCTRMPATLDFAIAAAMPTPAVTAIEWIEDDLKVVSGDRVLVSGATGAVGAIACYVARRRGAVVTAAVRRKYRAHVRYADDVITLDEAGAVPTQVFDCIADTIGGITAQRLLRALKSGKPLSTIATDPVLNPQALDVNVRFFGNYPIESARLGALAEAVARDDLHIDTPRTLRLSEAALAHELVERGGASKIVLVPDAFFR